MNAVGSSLGTWIDGVAGTAVPVDDRGLQYGDGLFETILVRAGQPRFLEAHLMRLTLGLARLGIPFMAADALRDDIARAAAQAPPLAIIKVIVTRGSSSRRGYAPDGTARARRIVSLWPTVLTASLASGVALGIAHSRAATSSTLAGLKHLSRLENVLAAAEIAEDEFDVIMVDLAHRVISGSSCNLFVVIAGRLMTPQVDTAGVAGVMRGIVLREAPRLGIGCDLRDLTLEDVTSADEVFVTNARIGVVPVKRVGEHSTRMIDLGLKLRAHVESLDA
jgi:4-amino-4-deoxychorismate lyase